MNTKERESHQHLIRRFRSPLGAMGIGITLALSGGSAMALNGNITVVKCANCVATADFVNYAVAWAVSVARPGTYAVISEVEARTAYVVVTGTLKTRCPRTEPCDTILANATGVAVDEAGIAASAESVLEDNDIKMFGASRRALIAPVRVNPYYGTSYIGNAAMAEDTSSAISNELYVQRGIPAGHSSLRVGTIVSVVWQDGTKAKFKRVMLAGSLQWAYVEGSARDKDGNKIDSAGNILGNRNTSGNGQGNAGFGGVSGWGFVATGRDRCLTVTEMYHNGIFQWSYTQILPC